MKKNLKITSLCIAIVFLVSLCFVPVYASDNNIAINATVTASTQGGDSSSNSACVNDGEINVDGNGTTKWFILSSPSSQWLQFGYDKNVTIGGALVESGGSNGADVISDFKFQYYFNNTWVDVPGSQINQNSSKSVEIDFGKIVTSTQFRFIPTSDNRFRIREIELYSADANSIQFYNSSDVNCPTDVSGTKYEKAVKRLINLGLLDAPSDNLFYPEYRITREEFVKWVVECMTAENNFPSRRIFIDVKPDDKYAPYITTAYDMEWIGIDGNSMFYPNKEITYTDACVMLVSALGYQDKVSAKNGNYSKYMKTAASIDIDNGISHRSDGYLTRGDCAIMINNTLDANVIELDTYGSDIKYAYGESALYKYNDIQSVIGIVTANNKATLTGDTLPPYGHVMIGSEDYLTTSSGADGFLGSRIKAYYKETDSDQKEILYVEEYHNTILNIDADDIEKTSYSSIVYTQSNNKSKTVTISNGATMLLNGGFSKITSSNYIPDYGYITLTDNNSDGKYEVVYIHSQINTKVIGRDTDNEIIYTEKGTFRLKDFDFYAVYKSGKKIDLSKVCDNDIITIEKSGENECFIAFVGTESISGTIDALTDDKIIIDDKEYKFLQEIKDKIHIGWSGKFYLSEGNVIIDIDYTDDIYKYGIVIGTRGEKGYSKGQVKILSQTGELLVCDVSNKINVNDKKLSVSDITDDLLIKYRLNSDNELRQVYIEQNADGIEYVENDNKGVTKFNDATGYFYRQGMLLDSQHINNYIFNNDTIVFSGPKDTENAEDDDFEVSKGTTVLTAKKYNDAIKIYDINDENVVKVAYLKYTNKQLPLVTSCPTQIVSKILKKKNSDGDMATCITVLENGKEKSFMVDEDSKYATDYNTFQNNVLNYKSESLENIKVGDVIQIKADEDNNISSYRILYKVADINTLGLLQYTGGNGDQLTYYPLLETLSGYLVNVGNSSVKILAGSDRYTYKNNGVNVYIFDINKKTVTYANSKELVCANSDYSGSRVFARVNAKVVTDIVVYR